MSPLKPRSLCLLATDKLGVTHINTPRYLARSPTFKHHGGNVSDRLKTVPRRVRTGTGAASSPRIRREAEGGDRRTLPPRGAESQTGGPSGRGGRRPVGRPRRRAGRSLQLARTRRGGLWTERRSPGARPRTRRKVAAAARTGRGGGSSP